MRRVMLDHRWCSVTTFVAPLLMLPFAAGCAERTAKVSGQVLYNDKPIPGGTVMFMPLAPGHSLASATLDEEGRYELTVAVGEAQILVDNRHLAPQGERPLPLKLPADLKLPPDVKLDGKAPDGGQKFGDQKPANNYREIPAKYYQFETSGLEYTVKGEPQIHNIELK